MARDVEADVKVNDKTSPGLRSVEDNFRKTGKKIEKDYDKFGKSTGEALLRGLGAVSPKLAGRLAESFGDASKLGASLLISGITAALPVLSGLIGSAVTGGAAGAGIIGGVALAERDPRVKEAGTRLASNLLTTLAQKASPFIAPVLDSIDQIGERFTANGAKIDRIFANSAKFVQPLSDSILNLIDSLVSGLDTAIGRAGPVLSAIESGITTIGQSIEGFIDNVTANAEGNAVILDQAFKSVAGTITLLGQVLGGVTYIFEQFNKIMPLSLLGQLNDLFNGTAEAGRRSQGGTFGAAEGMNRAGASAELAEQDTKLYNKALEDNARAAQEAANAQASLFTDLTRVGEAEDRATESAKKNGRTLSENTAKGRANRDSLAQLASTYNGYRANLEKSGASTTKVNGVMATQRTRLIDAARAMGATKSQAAALADQLLGIKPRSAKVTVTGTAQAASNARNVREEISQIRSKSVTVSVNTQVAQSRLAAVERRLARINGGNLSGAAGSFGAFANGQGSNRVGGPIEVQNSIAVALDGAPFYEFTATAIRSDNRRRAFRNHVGRRVA